VYYQTYVKKAERHFHETSLRSCAANIRKDLISKFKVAGIDGNRLSVLVAISLGDKSYLEKSLKNNYAGAGAMHILAVSGLHVGIVYLIFSALFSLLKLGDKVHNRILKGVILLIVVWGFAIITGLSPSVQRAACMFSFLIVADIVNRHSIALNSIAASAFFILLINPMMIFEVGFQLSYAAVFGIVWMHPIIYSWLSPKYWLLDKAWSLIVVSIAAQLATLPFTLYYFHQFPNWFLLTNLGVIPLAFVIVSGAIIVGFLLTIFSNAFFLEYLLEAALWLLNYFIGSLSRLPYFVTEGIWISSLSALLIAIFILLLGVYLQNMKAKWFLLSLATLTGVFLIETVRTVKQLGQKQMVVYSIRSQSVYSVIEGLTAELIVLSDTLDDYAEQIVLDHLNSKGVIKLNRIRPFANEKSKYLEKSEHFQALQMGKVVIMLNEGIPNVRLLKILPKETNVIVRKGEETNNQKSVQSTTKIVFDSSIPKWDYEYKKLINEGGVYTVSKSGYYIKNW
jgi:competence protein ComEC